MVKEIKKLFYKGSLGNQIFLKSQKAFKQIEWKDAWQVYKDESDVTADFHARREVNQFFSKMVYKSHFVFVLHSEEDIYFFSLLIEN